MWTSSVVNCSVVDSPSYCGDPLNPPTLNVTLGYLASSAHVTLGYLASSANVTLGFQRSDGNVTLPGQSPVGVTEEASLAM